MVSGLAFGDGKKSTETNIIRDKIKAKNIIIIVGLVLLFIVFSILSLKALGNEDDWICQNGEWVKHGNPSAEMPTTPCE